MSKPRVLGVIGALAVAVLVSQAVGAQGASAPASPVLGAASDLKPSHGLGSAAPYGYLPLHASDYGRAKAAANQRAGLGQGGIGAAGTSGGPAVTAYANVSPSFDGTYETGLAPPDTTGAIGPDRYIETINTDFAVYSRSGSLLGSGTLSALTGVPTGMFGYALSDPQMMWDAKTQRFYYSAVYYDSLLFSDNGIAIGWSKTATPTSASDFCQYVLQFGSELPDYPKLGDSADFLLYGYNEFGNYASTYDGSGFTVVNKPPAGSSCPSTTSFTVTSTGALHNADGSMAATPVPANLVDDGTGTGYVVANADLSTTPSANFVSVYSVSTNGVDANGIPVPAIGGPTNVAVPSYSMPSSAPQSGSSYLLDTLDGRFEAAVAAVDPAHGGKLAIWTAHSVYGGPGAEERWYEIDPGAGSLLQSGTVGSPSLFVWNGAVSPDRANNGSSASFGDSMAMSVSTSSTSTDPAIQFVWKPAGGAQSALANLVQSAGPDVDFTCSSTAPCRWGDYSGASPDPAAGGGSVGRVWLGNQYVLAGGTTSSTSWRTWIFAVTPGQATTGPSLSFASTPQTLTAGAASGPMQVSLSQAASADTAVTLSSSSSSGQFATNTGGPWSSTLPLTIPAGDTTSPSFYYEDTKAGSPTLTASAGSLTATQTETVKAAALTAITVSPASVTLAAGASQVFTAAGQDAYQNPVDVSGASWTATGGTVSPSTGSSTTYTAGSTAGTTWSVTASLTGVSGSASVTVTVSPPSAPTSLRASALPHQRIGLSWKSSGTGLTFDVYRSSTVSGSESLYASGVGGTSFTDTGVTAGTTYYYYVTAVGPGGESGPSNEAHATAKR